MESLSPIQCSSFGKVQLEKVYNENKYITMTKQCHIL